MKKKLFSEKEPETGCWMLDAGCWILDAGCWMCVSGFGNCELETLKLCDSVTL